MFRKSTTNRPPESWRALFGERVWKGLNSLPVLPNGYYWRFTEECYFTETFYPIELCRRRRWWSDKVVFHTYADVCQQFPVGTRNDLMEEAWKLREEAE